MDWTEIKIEIAASQVDAAAAIAQMVVPYGIYIEDYSDLLTEAPKIAHIDLIDEDLLAKDPAKAVIHVYISPDDNPAEAIAFLREKLTAAGIGQSISTEAVKQEEWSTAWKQYYHPLHLGRRLVVCPSWESYERAPDEVVLTLDPGMAFGTGKPRHHPALPGAARGALCPGPDGAGCGQRQRDPGHRLGAARLRSRRRRRDRPHRRAGRPGEQRHQPHRGSGHLPLRRPGGEGQRQL